MSYQSYLSENNSFSLSIIEISQFIANQVERSQNAYGINNFTSGHLSIFYTSNYLINFGEQGHTYAFSLS